MEKHILTPGEGAELMRLYSEHAKASTHAAAILQTHGMESREFFEADKATGVVWVRIRQILGIAGSHWMA